MFKVMVVDDEMIVRKGIMTSIDWSAHDIAITAEARNGQEALDRLRRHPVDLILTDIRMPVMSGIELAKAVRSEYPEIELVLLSGYEDFQYAKEAMSIGIRHYLLKPVIAEKLVATLADIRDAERDKRLAKLGELSKNKLFNENLPLIKTKLMHSLLDRKSDIREAAGKAEALGISLAGPMYQMIVAEADDDPHAADRLSQKEKEALAFAFLNVTEETLAARFAGFVSFGGEAGRLIGLIGLHPETPASAVRAACERIRSNLLRYLKLSVSIGIGSPVGRLLDIVRSYDEAASAVRRKTFEGKGKIFALDGGLEEETGRSGKMVKEVIRYVSGHFDKPIGLTEAAEHVSVTPAYLSKVFKEETGITFIKWLNRLRVEEAKRLLDDTWLKTYEIAEKVGFQDYKYFSLIFKTIAGCSPRDYRHRESRPDKGTGEAE